jgi:hypothetical protein
MRIPQVVVEDLLADPRLTSADRSTHLWAYVIQPRSIRELARKTGASKTAVARACRNLAGAKWMMLVKGQYAVRPVPLIPSGSQTALAQALEAGYAFARNKGEYLMKCYLDMWVNCDEFVDNARPEFLENPESSQPLEYDRFYPRYGIAFEFNGAQHYELGDEQSQKALRTRDLVKDALSRANGIALVTVKAEDLLPARFVQLLPDGLPHRHVDEESLHFRTLARLGTAYASKAARSTRQPGTTVVRRQ